MRRQAAAQIAPRSAVHGTQEALRRERLLRAREEAHGVVERALPVARAADLLVDPAHEEGGAVVEGCGLARAREVEAPAPVACEERDTAREARLRQPPGAALESERVVLGQALRDPAPGGAGTERLPHVEELVQVAARLVRGAERDVAVHEERAFAGEP